MFIWCDHCKNNFRLITFLNTKQLNFTADRKENLFPCCATSGNNSPEIWCRESGSGPTRSSRCRSTLTGRTAPCSSSGSGSPQQSLWRISKVDLTQQYNPIPWVYSEFPQDMYNARNFRTKSWAVKTVNHHFPLTTSGIDLPVEHVSESI